MSPPYLQEDMIDDIQWVNTKLQLCDMLTKMGKAPINLIRAITEGVF